MACRLGRHLSEVSPPCLFTDVFECLPWARRYSRKQDTASPPGRDRDSEGARSRGHSAIGVTIPGARSPGERVRLRKEK